MASWTPPNSEYPPPKLGEPPLHRAARIGDVEAIRELVSQGADVDEVFDLGLDPGARPTLTTPLMVAAGSGDGATIATVDLLLELGADPTTILNGLTSASFAVSGLGWNYRPGGDAERLRRLLDAGSPLPPDPTQAHRLLYDAAATANSEQLEILLNLGLSAKGFWDLEQIASEKLAMFDYIASSRRANSDVPEVESQGLLELMRTFREQAIAAEPVRPYAFQIPIFGAAQSGSLECLHLLLEHGADINARKDSNETALSYATSAEMIEALMDAGALLEDKNQFGWSSLVSAVHDGDLPKVQALLAAGANPNDTHDHGYTVFMCAVGSMKSDIEIVKTLVEAGADPYAVSDYGYNAFHAAIDGGGMSTESSAREIFRYLNDLGVDIEARTIGGQTPVALAVNQGSGLEVDILCELGANPNVVSMVRIWVDRTYTDVDLPLLFHPVRGAIAHRDRKTTTLLAFGADPFSTDGDGKQPIHYAVANLCQEGDSHDKSFNDFFEGLAEFDPIGASLLKERDSYIATATAWVQAYAEQFAADIPISDSYYAQEFRTELLNLIATLCAYGFWASEA